MMRRLLVSKRDLSKAPSCGWGGVALKERLMAAVDYFNRDPVVHTWTYKLDKAA
jgi:hypothetical protein